MKTRIVFLINFILPFAYALHGALRNFDDNNVGIDDKAADIVQQFIDGILAFKATLGEIAQKEGVARGYTAIKNYGNNILQLLEGLKTSNLPLVEKQAQARLLIDSLSDTTKVYPAKKGDDGQLLKELKEKAEKLFSEITTT